MRIVTYYRKSLSYKSSRILAALWGILLLATISCQVIWFQEKETLVSFDEGFLEYDPEALLPIAGNDFLQSLNPIPSMLPKSQYFNGWGDTISWEDYELILNVLHEYIWGESIDEFDLAYLNVRTNCHLDNREIELIEFQHRRILLEVGEKTRLVREVSFYPMQSTIYWSESKWAPVSTARPSIDVSQQAVFISDALQIMNSYQETISVDISRCVTVALSLVPEFSPESYVWRVRFLDSEAWSLHEIYINPSTGKITDSER